jgi:hypothetical protein
MDWADEEEMFQLQQEIDRLHDVIDAKDGQLEILSAELLAAKRHRSILSQGSPFQEGGISV